jgi:hypothetical protein
MAKLQTQFGSGSGCGSASPVIARLNDGRYCSQGREQMERSRKAAHPSPHTSGPPIRVQSEASSRWTRIRLNFPNGQACRPDEQSVRRYVRLGEASFPGIGRRGSEEGEAPVGRRKRLKICACSADSVKSNLRRIMKTGTHRAQPEYITLEHARRRAASCYGKTGAGPS